MTSFVDMIYIPHDTILRHFSLVVMCMAIVLISCDNQVVQQRSQTIPALTKNENSLMELTTQTRYNAFDKTVGVTFFNTIDSISTTQAKNLEGFVLNQDIWAPQIMQKIFEYYRMAYPDYKIGATIMGDISNEELEEFLPTPTTPENLKKFITPLAIHIQGSKSCEEGTLGIVFDCTWDAEHGLGVLIKDWKVVEVSFAELVYF